MDLNQGILFDDVTVSFREFLDSLSDGVLIIDRFGRILWMNRQALDYAPPTDEERLYQTLDYFYEQGLAYNPPVAPIALREKKQVTRVMNYPGGRKALVTATPILDGQGEPLIVISTIRDVTELYNLQQRLESVEKESSDYRRKWKFLFYRDQMFGGMKSRQMQQVLNTVLKVSDRDVPILITGESGVGKTTLARFIHKTGNRSEGAFVHLNCSSVPETLLESELFGFEAGAFTGASRGKAGLFQMADKGTVLLDEIGEMPLYMQTKLLNFLQEQVFYRLGGTSPIRVDCRIIVATNARLEQLVKAGKIREDLYYRINVFQVNIPPLRERPDDVLSCIHSLVKELNGRYGKGTRLTEEALEAMLGYSWPGNLRQLRNVVERLVIMADSDLIEVDQLPAELLEQEKRTTVSHRPSETAGSAYPPPGPGPEDALPLQEALVQFERDYISRALATNAPVKEIAQRLGVDVSTLYRKIRRLDISTGDSTSIANP